MTARVEFHTGVADPIGFACRLLRKVYKLGNRVIVTGSRRTVGLLDQALWQFESLEFIPHAVVANSSPSVLRLTPIWLATEPLPSELPGILINIDAGTPDQGAALERIIEIVGQDDTAAHEGRARWRTYESWGVQPVHHRAG